MNHFESSVINLIWTKKLVLLYKNKGSNNNQPNVKHPTFFLRQISHCKTKVRTVLDKIWLSDQTLWQGIQLLGKPD
jgi:hypothetical protein